MRLTAKEVRAIQQGFSAHLSSFKLFLFGSRVDDSKKGGDIDLLVVVDPEQKNNVVRLKSRIRLKIFEIIDEQKIDITVATQDELASDVFLSSVFPASVLLLDSVEPTSVSTQVPLG